MHTLQRIQRFVFLVGIAGLVVIGGCSSGEGSPHEIPADSVIEYRLDDSPVRVFGREHVLHPIQHVAFADTTVFIITLSPPFIHAFGPKSYRTWGAKGGAPEEINSPSAVHVIGDQLVVLDFRYGRSKILKYASGATVPSFVSLAPYRRVEEIGVVEGVLVVSVSEGLGGEHALVRTDTMQDTVLTFQGPSEVHLNAGSMRVTIGQPFGARALWTTTPAERLAYWPGQGRHVFMLDLQGRRTDSLRLPPDTIPINQEDRLAWIEEAFSPNAVIMGQRDPLRVLREQALETLDFPDHFPLAMDLKPDPNGGIWVLRMRRQARETWMLLRKDAAPVRIIFPPRRRVKAFGETYFAIKAVDEDGAQTVELYEREGI